MPILFLAPMINFSVFNPTGAPLVGGKVYTAQPGTVAGPGQSYPKATYTDSTGTVANTNPVILDGSGKASIWLDAGYSIAIYDAAGVLVESQDNVGGSGSGTSSTSFADASFATVNETILSANDPAAEEMLFIKTDTSANEVVITPTTGTILGQADYSLTTQNESVRLVPHAALNDWKKA